MFPFSRHIAAGSALSILMAGTALGDAAPVPNPVSNSVFSPANIVGGLLRGVVSYGRMVADIRYGALEVDGLRGGLTLRDLQIAGVGKHERCRIDLGLIHVSGLTFWAEEESQVHIDLSDLAIANNCFGPDAAMIGMITGADSIPLETLSINLSQSSGSGAVTADIEAISPGIARIEGSVDFDYVSLFSPDLIEKLAQKPNYGELVPPTFDQDGNMIPPEDDPAGEPQFGLRGTLSAGHLSVENLGLWERIQPLLPPDATNPQALQALVTAPPGSKLNDAQRALASTLEGFMANPGRVTAEIRPPAPVSFDTTRWTTPEDALALFPLVFTNALPTPPVALIADTSDAADARALGLALADGHGVPQNTRRAIELLEPLSEDPEVVLVLARLLAGSDPAAGYAHALRAAAMGVPGAPATLDRIEAQLPTKALLAAQAPADDELPATVFDSVTALRDAAQSHERGDGARRSYALAWRLAAAAAATGDSAAKAIMTRLDNRFGADPDWIQTRDAAADLAVDDWTSHDLASRLAASPATAGAAN
ncbi:MAG: sel1 repeat family protein [Paracoccus sp.]|nr:sel1 repeat family protein [Paracoccus sp. (in: a-proteobacteria)]